VEHDGKDIYELSLVLLVSGCCIFFPPCSLTLVDSARDEANSDCRLVPTLLNSYCLTGVGISGLKFSECYSAARA
jgi:hypothetical protein